MAKKKANSTSEKDDRTPGAKISEIFNGWKNVVFPNEHVENIAKARAKICSQCEHNVKNRCKKCGCPLIAKTRSMQSHCPLKKW
jgi:hypothetical protein